MLRKLNLCRSPGTVIAVVALGGTAVAAGGLTGAVDLHAFDGTTFCEARGTVETATS